MHGRTAAAINTVVGTIEIFQSSSFEGLPPNFASDAKRLMGLDWNERCTVVCIQW